MPSNRSERVGPALDAIITTLKFMPQRVRSGQESFTTDDLNVEGSYGSNYFHLRYALMFLVELGFIRYNGISSSTRSLKTYRFYKGHFGLLRKMRRKVKNK